MSEQALLQTSRQNRNGQQSPGPDNGEPVPGSLMASLNQSSQVTVQAKFQQAFNRSPLTLFQAQMAGTIQRKCRECAAEEDLQAGLGISQRKTGTVQKQAAPANRTGLPDDLKTGMESLSGLSLDDVNVHYNSDKPAQLQALAYTQGTDIHVAPGEEKNLAHEAWHVVQQKQGRVAPTTQLQGVAVNDDTGLEREADAMGKQAEAPFRLNPEQPIQRVLDPDKWMVNPIRDQKQSIKTPAKWGETALHHKVSKANLSDLGQALVTALQARDPAAEGFWNLIRGLAGSDVVEAATHGKPLNEQVIRTLWNLPVNLELGPKIVAEDPGIGFDPNTEPDLESGKPGARKLTPESSHLLAFENKFLEKRDEGFEGEDWEELGQHLLNAFEAQGGSKLIQEPRTEQWIQAGEKAFVRRGLRSYPGLEYGTEKFSRYRKEAEVIEGLAGDKTPAWEITQTLTDGTQLIIRLTNEVLHHIYTRHTYQYWDPKTPGSTKAVNTFWPGTGFDIEDQLLSVIPSVLPAIGGNIARQLPDTRDPGEFGAHDLSGVAALGSDRFFYFATVFMDYREGEEEPFILAELDTVAPAGQGAEAYEPAELTKIGRQLL